MADVEQLIHMTSGLVDGVTRLREIVLHAAVHGTLVSQDTSDEPADVLLARSRAAVDRQTQAGRAKREKPAAELEPAEQHFKLPTGWAWARIVDTGQYINGLAFKPSDWKSKGRPIIRIQNLSGRNPDFNYTDGTFDPSVVVHDGDILVSWSATLDAFIWRGVEGVLNQHIFRVVPAPLVDKAYLFWLLKWVIRRMAASDHVHGLVMGHINRGPFLAFPVPIPPLAEQKRIVAKVDELMALCDRLEAQLQERDARSAELSKAALAKFSEEPTVENLEYLFHPSFAVPVQQIRECVRKSATSGRLLLGLEGTSAWPEVELGSIGEWGSGGTPLRTDPSYYGGSIPWIVIGDLNNGVVSSAATSITQEGLDNSSAKLLPPGVLLIAMYGSIGKLGITGIDCATNQAIAFCKPDPQKVELRFLFHLLASLQPEFLARGQGLAQKNISQTILKAWKVKLPPLAEQKRIVAKVEELMALVDQLEAQLAASEEAGTKLLDALVAEIAPSN